MLPPGLTRYRDTKRAFSLALPDAWARNASADGMALVALETGEDTPFRANLVVTVEDVMEGTDLRSWQMAVDEVMPSALDDYLLLDLELTEVGGIPALRRLAHYLSEAGQALTMEQWAIAAGGRGYTLTATAHTLAYDSQADFFAFVAYSFRVAANASVPAGDAR